MTDRQADRARQIETILQQVDRLPTLSPIAARLLEVTDVDDVDLAQVAQLIETDVALSATVLKLVRAADLGLSHRITSVKQAIMLLGLDTVRSAVLSVEVLDLFEVRSSAQDLSTQTGFDNHGFWKHAVAVACASQLLAKESSDPEVEPDMAFLAGLLHGLGKLVLHMVLPQAYDRALAIAEQKHAKGASVERAILGIDHHTVGRRLADRWGLPHWLRDVIWFNGQPLEAVPGSAPRSMIATVSLASAWCQKHHLGWSGDFAADAPIGSFAEAASIPAAKLPDLVQHLLEDIVDRESIIGLGSETPPEALLQAIARANQRLGSLNASLEKQARAGRRRELIARYTATFLDQLDCGQPMEKTLASIRRSAASLFGATYCGIVWRSSTDGSCRFMHAGASCDDEHPHAVTLPLMKQRLREILGPSGGMGVAASSVLPCLDSFFDGAAEVESVRVFPIAIDDDIEVILIHNAELSGWNERTDLGPMRSVWASSVRAASVINRSRGLEDDLATANRALGEMQSELAERASMARLGEMTAGAAHEMNNPLAVIHGRAQMLCSKLEGTELGGCAAAIAASAADLSDLITDLNVLARMSEPTLALSDATEVVRDALALATDRIGHPIEVEVEIDAEAGSMVTDRKLLAHALEELFVNAHEACSAEKVRMRVHADPDAGRLYFRIEDRGCGLSEKALRHAFDPFFSEKPAGRQRGFGLAKARRGIELLGGRIWVEARQGGGTAACIALNLDPSIASAA